MYARIKVEFVQIAVHEWPISAIWLVTNPRWLPGSKHALTHTTTRGHTRMVYELEWRYRFGPNHVTSPPSCIWNYSIVTVITAIGWLLSNYLVKELERGLKWPKYQMYQKIYLSTMFDYGLFLCHYELLTYILPYLGATNIETPDGRQI